MPASTDALMEGMRQLLAQALQPLQGLPQQIQDLSARLSSTEASVAWIQDHAVLDENLESFQPPPGAPVTEDAHM